MLSRHKIKVHTQPRRPRGRPKSGDVAALEARLLLVGRRTFFAHGYGATSMTAIARAARVSKNTLYARFAGKAALFHAIMSDQINRMEQEIRETVHHDGNTLEDALRAYGNRMLKASLVGELLQANRLLYSESDRFPELGEEVFSRAKIGNKQVAAFIREFADKGKHRCRDPEGAAEVYVMMLRGWYNHVMLSNRRVGPAAREAWVDKAVEIFLASRSKW